MTEAFPPLHGQPPHNTGVNGAPRRRRRSSVLGSDVPGDVDVPALATHRTSTPPLNSPTSMDSVRLFASSTLNYSLDTMINGEPRTFADYGLPAESREIRPPLQTTNNTPLPLQGKAHVHTSHMAAPPGYRPHHRIPLRYLSVSVKPAIRLPLPVLPARARRPLHPRKCTRRP